ncbi:cyclase family protein [Salicibibacter halophilus]|uniref:Cyclase family protein n=1 Tax=Salicibibacter halophilus TaxID=2502791 RepID=A0A514LFN4_9BACI|nr:cyclase family protein [Salicibibacter halophilus]QDI90670.1 cyclase family protein [Salicibibacter halophilus]
MEVIDLTKTIFDGMPVYSGDPEVKIDVATTVKKDGHEVRSLRLGSHTGTHVDAFSHMHEGMASLDDIPLTQFYGRAVRVTPKMDFPAHTGLFFGEDVGEDVLEKIIAASPPFVGGSLSEELESGLLAHKIVTYTDLVKLDLIPSGEVFTFFGLPLKIENGDGSPVRAIAVLGE